jgi:hypothetical protein
LNAFSTNITLKNVSFVVNIQILILLSGFVILQVELRPCHHS